MSVALQLPQLARASSVGVFVWTRNLLWFKDIFINVIIIVTVDRRYPAYRDVIATFLIARAAVLTHQRASDMPWEYPSISPGGGPRVLGVSSGLSFSIFTRSLPLFTTRCPAVFLAPGFRLRADRAPPPFLSAIPLLHVSTQNVYFRTFSPEGSPQHLSYLSNSFLNGARAFHVRL